MKNKIQYWIVPVFGCIEPESLVGPFLTFGNMKKRAKKVHAEQSEDDAIFWLRTQDGKKPQINAFVGSEWE